MTNGIFWGDERPKGIKKKKKRKTSDIGKSNEDIVSETFSGLFSEDF